MEVLLDASAIMAVIADEPESETVIDYTKDAIIVSPNMVSFEIANGLTKMLKRKVINNQEDLIRIIESFEKIQMKTVEVDLKESLKIAWKYKIYAYDAFYSALGFNTPPLAAVRISSTHKNW